MNEKTKPNTPAAKPAAPGIPASGAEAATMAGCCSSAGAGANPPACRRTWPKDLAEELAREWAAEEVL